MKLENVTNEKQLPKGPFEMADFRLDSNGSFLSMDLRDIATKRLIILQKVDYGCRCMKEEAPKIKTMYRVVFMVNDVENKSGLFEDKHDADLMREKVLITFDQSRAVVIEEQVTDEQ